MLSYFKKATNNEETRTTLESLPVDIKLLILLNIPDYPTILALNSISHGFSTTYARYESLVATEPLYADALLYEEESFFLACYSDLLSREEATIEWDEFRDIRDSYVEPEKTASGWSTVVLRSYRAKFCEGGKAMKQKLVENHKMIMQHCEHFIRTERYPRLSRAPEVSSSPASKYDRCKGEISATEKERSRIVRAFYRLWVLALIYNYNRRWDVHNNNIHGLLDYWGFWRVKNIQIVAMHLREQTNPVFEHFRPRNNKELLDQFSGRYLCDRRSYPEGMPYGDDNFRRAKHFYHKFHFAAFILHSFPHSSLPLLQSSNPDSLKPAFIELTNLVSTATASLKKTNTSTPGDIDAAENSNRLINCLSFCDCIFDGFKLTATNMLTQIKNIDRADIYLVSNPFVGSQSPKATRPLCREETTGAYRRYYAKPGAEAALIAWQGLELSRPDSKDSDYYGAIWDDWRLQAWGYRRPNFGPQDWVFRRMTNKVIRTVRFCRARRGTPTFASQVQQQRQGA